MFLLTSSLVFLDSWAFGLSLGLSGRLSVLSGSRSGARGHVHLLSWSLPLAQGHLRIRNFVTNYLLAFLYRFSSVIDQLPTCEHTNVM